MPFNSCMLGRVWCDFFLGTIHSRPLSKITILYRIGWGIPDKIFKWEIRSIIVSEAQKLLVSAPGFSVGFQLSQTHGSFKMASLTQVVKISIRVELI